MSKDDFMRIIIGVLVLLLVLAYSAGQVSTANVYGILQAVLSLLLIVAVISLGAE